MAKLHVQSNMERGNSWYGMRKLLQSWLLEPAPSIRRQDDRREARLLSAFLLINLCGFIISIIALMKVSEILLNLLILLWVMIFIAYAISRSGRYRTAASIMVLTNTLTPFVIAFTVGDYALINLPTCAGYLGHPLGFEGQID